MIPMPPASPMVIAALPAPPTKPLMGHVTPMGHPQLPGGVGLTPLPNVRPAPLIAMVAGCPLPLGPHPQAGVMSVTKVLMLQRGSPKNRDAQKKKTPEQERRQSSSFKKEEEKNAVLKTCNKQLLLQLNILSKFCFSVG